MKEPSGALNDFYIMLGEFGEANHEITKTTDQKFYNTEFGFEFGKTMKEPGVVGEDRAGLCVHRVSCLNCIDDQYLAPDKPQ